jgi:hypothetical protein
MKQTILFAFVVTTFFSCMAPTQIVNSWRDPGTTIKDPGIHKIVVAALLTDQGVRRQVEDYMASLYPGTATQSYLLIGADSLLANEQANNQKLKGLGYDGIVIMRQINENTTQHYVPGQFPMYYNSWGGYWGNGWGTSFYYPGTPGHFATDRTWIVQVNVYSIVQDKLIWSANTRTTDPGGRIPLFTDVCNTVRKEMKTQGFLM